MLFNSWMFALFLPIVFVMYWYLFSKNNRTQNIFIILISYFFYGCWSPKFLILISITSIACFFSGLLINKYRDKEKKAKLILILNLILNLGILCIFKYFNFFTENFIELLNLFGLNINTFTLNIVLPVGISFYTFQSISYPIDVYKRKIESTNDIFSFFAFVSFFPQLVAGPIERASKLLPQFYKKREFDYAEGTLGLRMIMWGLFKKMVIADNCGYIVDRIFPDYQDLNASTLFFGAFFFTFQIYGDFSGYSDIAIGCGKLFGIKLSKNFDMPYFARSISEFWRRWHITLNHWLREYIYFPLGGSRSNKFITARNTIAVFLLSGLWHGASWKYIAWSSFHAILFMPRILLEKKNKYKNGIAAENTLLPSLKELWLMSSTFLLVMFSRVLYRAESVTQAIDYIRRIFDVSFFEKPYFFGSYTIFYIIFMIIVEWITRKKDFPLETVYFKNKYAKGAIYYLFVVGILMFAGRQASFIYFQF